MPKNDGDELLSITGLIDYLAGEVARQTIYRWNSERSGPPYLRAGRRVFYRRSDVDAWMAGRQPPVSGRRSPAA
jgi:predicted DNA-binding transcriptional regulator AlpA